MVEGHIDLISMADIARLAGQSRATVGNWKARNPDDFPPERGRGTRGPLYGRAEVTAWLEATNRLGDGPPEVTVLWKVADEFRGALPTEDVLPLLLILLALMSKVPSAWEHLQRESTPNLERAVRDAVHQHLPDATDILPARALPSPVLAAAVNTLSSVDPSRVGALADAALEQSAKALGTRGGEFLSPPSVRKLVIALADPAGTIYNPATGAGQLLVDTATSSRSGAVNLVGQEIDVRIWAISKLNIALHDVDADIALGDVFTEDRFPNLRADCVVSVPPWNQRFLASDLLHDDRRWVWGEPGPADGNAAWVQHCLAHLGDGGRAVIVLPNGVLFESGRSGRIRQRILKAGLLDAVFALPSGLFPGTTIPCAILVFRKGRSDVSGKPAPALMVDLTASAAVPDRGVSSLSDRVISDVGALYRRWVSGEAPDSDFASVANYDDLAANDFVIDPGRYLSLRTVTVDRVAAEKRREVLTQTLDELTVEAHRADERLRAVLGRSG